MFLKNILSCNFISLISDLAETAYVRKAALNTPLRGLLGIHEVPSACGRVVEGLAR